MDNLDRIALIAQLQTIRGHLRAVERLIAADRPLDAALQLRAVRGAVAKAALAVCRAYLAALRSEETPPDAPEDLLAMARMTVGAARCCRRARWRSMSLAVPTCDRN